MSRHPDSMIETPGAAPLAAMVTLAFVMSKKMLSTALIWNLAVVVSMFGRLSVCDPSLDVVASDVGERQATVG